MQRVNLLGGKTRQILKKGLNLQVGNNASPTQLGVKTMDKPEQERIFEEREFLRDIGQCLNKALFIIDRLTEELREEEGRLEDDPEIQRLFLHLNSHITRVEGLIKDRHGLLSEVLDKELHPEKKIKKESSFRNSPPRSP